MRSPAFSSVPLDRLAQLGAGGAGVIALLALAGWVLEHRIWASWGTGWIPMAPSTALAFVLLGSAVLAQARWPESRSMRGLAWTAAVLAAAQGLLAIASFATGREMGLEEWLSGPAQPVQGHPAGRMAPFTAVALLSSSLALGCLLLRTAAWSRARDTAAGMAATAMAIGLAVLVGYLFATPLFYGGPVVPVALPTAVSLVLLGAGQLAAVGPRSRIVRHLAGRSAWARLLRTFLPLVMAVVLADDWIDARRLAGMGGNPALWAMLKAAGAGVSVGGICLVLARRLGRRVDRTEAALHRLQGEVWAMKGAEGVDQVIRAIGDVLAAREIPFLAYAINVVVAPQGELPIEVYIHDPDGRQSRSALRRDHPATRIVLEAWTSREVLYRPDLAEENIYGEHLAPPEQPHHPRVRSAVDVPFSQGTLALASAHTGALSAEDLSFLAVLAQVIEGGFQRAADLQRLEQHNRALTTEIDERQRTEEALRQAEANLKTDLAVQRVRAEVLQMQQEADWDKVVVAAEHELRNVLEFADCSISLVDLSQNTVRFHRASGGNLSPALDAVQVHPALRTALETGQPVYRSHRGDPLLDEELPLGIHSVIDVPYAGGTLALNSAAEDAFSQRDIHLLERFAQVMSEAHRRLEELQLLALREQQLHQSQKLEAIGRLATGVAHELNNPLTSVLGYSELLLRGELGAATREGLETIRQEGERARAIAGRLLSFAHRQKLASQAVEIDEVVRETVALARRQLELDQVQVVEELTAGPATVAGQAGQLQQVVLELLHNSHQAMTEAKKGGRVWVRTRRQDRVVRVEVEDDGPGIPEGIRERVFDPFFTTRKVGRGTGLGLSVCHTIAQEHGGRLWSEPRAGGACLVLELPAKTEAAEGASVRAGTAGEV